MKEIPLTRGYVSLVSDEDYERVSAHKWCASSHNSRIYAVAHIPGTGHGTMKMHRFILDAKGRKEVVDHIDNDTLNNQRENIRLCTTAENTRNSKLERSNNTSGYKGVVRDKKCNVWRAQIMFNYKNFGLGRFNCPIEAARAYDAKAKELHGEFANLNFK